MNNYDPFNSLQLIKASGLFTLACYYLTRAEFALRVMAAIDLRDAWRKKGEKK
jgi:hypothetical protein